MSRPLAYLFISQTLAPSRRAQVISSYNRMSEAKYIHNHFLVRSLRGLVVLDRGDQASLWWYLTSCSGIYDDTVRTMCSHLLGETSLVR